MGQVIAHAPAKVNLALEVEPLRTGEEKHRLNSVFCTTSLADTLVFDFVSGREPFNAQLTFKSADLDMSYLKEQDNTLIKTVEQFKRSYGFGFLPSGTLHVDLIKSIPTQAGLGGGSSDAAAMLRMLCWLAQVEPLSEQSLAIAQTVGADVPFFLHAPKEGFCAHMGGYGDELIAVLPKPKLSMCLVKPEQGISTKRAYELFDSSAETPEAGTVENLVEAVTVEKGPEEIAALCANNLEQAATQLLPQIAQLKEELAAYPGVLNATLCGSGSALFAICKSPEAAQACMQHFASKGLWTVAVQT